MTGGKRTCFTCGDGFIGTARALYCSPACKQRAHRSRKASDASPSVTVTLQTGAAHCAEAIALLAALEEELAASSEERGGDPLEWSAAERTVLELVADSVDRRIDLWVQYREARDDTKLRIKLSTELRLLEANIARLLKQIKTDLPPEQSRRSQKASQAASARWNRAPS